jgi:hypothetical protein
MTNNENLYLDSPIRLLNGKKGQFRNIVSLADIIVYHTDDKLYTKACNQDLDQRPKILDEKTQILHAVNENYAITITSDGTLKAISNSSGYCIDLLNLELSHCTNKVTDPIHEIIISVDSALKLVCIANINNLHILEIDFDYPQDSSVKVLSSTKLTIEMDADIASGSLWGDIDTQHLVYRSCASIFSFELEKGDSFCIKSAAEYRTDHRSYLSNDCIGVSISGDYSGLLVVWKTAKKLEPWFTVEDQFKTEITCIEVVNGDHMPLSFWIGDITGMVVLFELDYKFENLVRKMQICAGTFGLCHPSQLYFTSLGSDCRLRLASTVSGMAIEVNFGLKTEVLFNADKCFYEDGHRSLIVCASVVKELSILIVVTWSGLINFWNYKSGSMIDSLSRNDSGRITAIASAFVAPNRCRFAFGTASGSSFEYLLSVNTPEIVEIENSLFKIIDDDLSISSAKGIEAQPEVEAEESSQSYLLPSDNVTLTIMLQGEQMYSHLPVTEILYSSLVEHLGICYARHQIMAHVCRTNLPSSQLTLEGIVLNVSSFFENATVTLDSQLDLSSDKLLVVLQGEKIIRVLDVLSREYIFTLDSFTESTNLGCCFLWRLDADDKIGGIYCTKSLSIHSLDCSEERNVTSQTVLSSFGDHGSLVDRLPGGLDVLLDGDSGLVVNWTFRQLVAMLVPIGVLANRNSSKTLESVVMDDRCRIVKAVGLNIASRLDRATRILVLLSDGVCFLLSK